MIESYKSIGNEIDNCKISDVKEISGKGVEAKVNGEQIFVGNKRLMESINIKVDKCKHAGTTIYVASKEKYYGHIVISDKIKSDTFSTIEYLKKNNIRTIVLTGDNKDVAKEISNNLNIDEYHAELLPQDKVDKIDEVFKNIVPIIITLVINTILVPLKFKYLLVINFFNSLKNDLFLLKLANS